MTKRPRFSIPHISNAPMFPGPSIIDHGGLALMTVLAPTGYRIARVDVSAGTVEFERMVIAAGAKKPKRKAR